MAFLVAHVVRRHVCLRCSCREEKTEIDSIECRFLSCCGEQMTSGNKTAIPHMQKLPMEFWDELTPEKDQMRQFI